MEIKIAVSAADFVFFRSYPHAIVWPNRIARFVGRIKNNAMLHITAYK